MQKTEIRYGSAVTADGSVYGPVGATGNGGAWPMRDVRPLNIEDLRKASAVVAAMKHDNGKPSMDLLPVEAKKAIARVFDFGAKKYARHNWRNGFDYSRLIAACERHMDAFNDGEDNDPESGESHLAHAGCCIMMLLESVIKGYGRDNRHKPVS